MPIVAEAEGTTTTAVAEQARVQVTGTAAPVTTGQPDTSFLRFVFSDNGTDWDPLRFAERVDAAPSMVVVVYDYESPPNTSRLYAAHGGRVLGGADIIGDRSASAAATLTLDSWWLKDPLDPQGNMKVQLYRRGDTMGETVSTERRDDSMVIGRKYGGTISDVIEAERFERTFTLYGDAELDAFENLRERRRTLLLQDMHGRGRRAQYYVRLGKDRRLAKLVTQGFETEPVYRVTIEMDERARP